MDEDEEGRRSSAEGWKALEKLDELFLKDPIKRMKGALPNWSKAGRESTET